MGGYGQGPPAAPPSPPFTPADLVDQSGYSGGFDLAHPSPQSAIVERYYFDLVLPGTALVAQPNLGAPFAGIPVATFFGQAVYLANPAIPARFLNVLVHPQDILRIKRFGVAFQPPAGRVIMVANVEWSFVQPQGFIELPSFRAASDVAI